MLSIKVAFKSVYMLCNIGIFSTILRYSASVIHSRNFDTVLISTPSSDTSGVSNSDNLILAAARYTHVSIGA